MYLDREERLQLLMEMKRKELSLTKVAEASSISVSLLSQYINAKCEMSKENVEHVVKFVKSQKEYRTIRVPIE